MLPNDYLFVEINKKIEDLSRLRNSLISETDALFDYIQELRLNSENIRNWDTQNELSRIRKEQLLKNNYLKEKLCLMRTDIENEDKEYLEIFDYVFEEGNCVDTDCQEKEISRKAFLESNKGKFAGIIAYVYLNKQEMFITVREILLFILSYTWEEIQYEPKFSTTIVDIIEDILMIKSDIKNFNDQEYYERHGDILLVLSLFENFHFLQKKYSGILKQYIERAEFLEKNGILSYNEDKLKFTIKRAKSILNDILE